MRGSNLPLIVLCLITLLAGAVVGAALRAGMQGGLRVEAGEPYWMASNARR
jgi:hypothetical protein